MTPRKVWLAFKTPLTLLLLLAFCAVSAGWAYKAVLTPIPPRPPDPCVVTNVGPNYTTEHAYLRIYNGTGQGGLAKNVVKLIFGNAGFRVYKVDNSEQPVTKTYIAGVEANSPEVKLLRGFLPANTPFVADPVKYGDHVVDLYLGTDFKSSMINTHAPKSVPLADGKACLPPYKTVSTGE